MAHSRKCFRHVLTTGNTVCGQGEGWSLGIRLLTAESWQVQTELTCMEQLRCRSCISLDLCRHKGKCRITADLQPNIRPVSPVCLRSELLDHVDSIDSGLENLQNILNTQTFSFDTVPLIEVSLTSCYHLTLLSLVFVCH